MEAKEEEMQGLLREINVLKRLTKTLELLYEEKEPCLACSHYVYGLNDMNCTICKAWCKGKFWELRCEVKGEL